MNDPDICELRYVDEHATLILAERELVWAALGGVLAPRGGKLVAVGTWLLGAQPASGRGGPLRAGSTIPGFAVIGADPPSELCLAGRHRFARYVLCFRLAAHNGATSLRAETRATFPGPTGSAFRAVVIGTGAHTVAVRRLLDRVRRHAETTRPIDQVRPLTRKMRTVAAATRAAVGWRGNRDGGNVRATFNGVVLARSRWTIVIEGNHYFPPEDVDFCHLQPSTKKTTCWWKGTARYYDIVVDGSRVEAAAWTYPTPRAAANQIEDHVAFWGDVQVRRSAPL